MRYAHKPISCSLDVPETFNIACVRLLVDTLCRRRRKEAHLLAVRLKGIQLLKIGVQEPSSLECLAHFLFADPTLMNDNTVEPLRVPLLCPQIFVGLQDVDDLKGSSRLNEASEDTCGFIDRWEMVERQCALSTT